MSLAFNPTTGELDLVGAAAAPSAPVTLAAQAHLTDRSSATVLYDGIAVAGTAVSSATWSLVKTVLTGNDYESRQVWTATGSWNNRAAATYSLSTTY